MATFLTETPSDPAAPLRMRLEATDQFAKLFWKDSSAEWNSMIRAGLKAGGEAWIAEYLPLRFTGYARSELGYNGKKTKKLPLVKTGNLHDTALSQSWAEAAATSSNASVVLHIATGTAPPNKNGSTAGYNQQPLVYRTLTTITEREIEFIALKMQATIIGLIEGAESSVSRKGTVRGRLTATQRQSIAPTSRPSSPTKRIA